MTPVASHAAEPTRANRSALDANVDTSAATEFIFRVKAPGASARLVRIKTPKCAIGSRPDCTLRLKGQGVAPVNCLLTRSATGALVRRIAGDVRVNGLDVFEATLHYGEELSIGRFTFELLNEEMLAAASAPRAVLDAALPAEASPTASPIASPKTATSESDARPASDTSETQSTAEPVAATCATAAESTADVAAWRSSSGDPQAVEAAASLLAIEQPAYESLSDVATKRTNDEQANNEQAQLAAELSAATSKLDALRTLYATSHHEVREWQSGIDAKLALQANQTDSIHARCEEIAGAVERLTRLVEGVASGGDAEVAENVMAGVDEFSRGGHEPIETSQTARGDSEPDGWDTESEGDANKVTPNVDLRSRRDETAAWNYGAGAGPLSVHDSHADFLAGLDAVQRSQAANPDTQASNRPERVLEPESLPQDAPAFLPVSAAAPVSAAEVLGQHRFSEERPRRELRDSGHAPPDDRPVYNPWRTGGFHATPDVAFRKHEAGPAAMEDEHDRTVREYVAGLLKRSSGASPEDADFDDAPETQPASAARQSARWAEPQAVPRRTLPADAGGYGPAPLAEQVESSPTASQGDEPNPASGSTPGEIVPRAKAPEKTVNLAAMRELALDNAKAALDTHARKQRAERVQVWLIVSLTALAMSFVFMWLSTSGSALHYGGAVLFLAVAIGFGLRYWSLSKKHQGAETQQPQSERRAVSQLPMKTAAAEAAGRVQEAGAATPSAPTNAD